MIETKVQSAIAHSKGKSLRIIDKSNIGVKSSVILGTGTGTGSGTGWIQGLIAALFFRFRVLWSTKSDRTSLDE